MGEGTVQFRRKKAFATLYREVAQDERLSLESRGLLVLMASLPEDWEYSVSGLAKKAGCGKDKLRRILGSWSRWAIWPGSRATGATENSAEISTSYRTTRHRCPGNPTTVKPVNGKHRRRVSRHKIRIS